MSGAKVLVLHKLRHLMHMNNQLNHNFLKKASLDVMQSHPMLQLIPGFDIQLFCRRRGLLAHAQNAVR